MEGEDGGFVYIMKAITQESLGTSSHDPLSDF